MKLLTATVALALAGLSASAGAQDGAGYSSWGACISVWVDLNHADWRASNASGEKAAGTALMHHDVPQYLCVQVDHTWYLVPVDRG
jgi:hypothetical protein